MKRAIIDLGFGDSGKGTIVDYFCRTDSPDLVVRFNGGHQAAHHVHLPNGTKHVFSQFGSGTFHGVPTYLASPVVIEPLALMEEAKALNIQYMLNKILYLHADCLITTPIHKIFNISDNINIANGTCGVGFGKTIEFKIGNFHPIYVKDFIGENGNKAIYKLNKLGVAIEKYATIDPYFKTIIEKMPSIDFIQKFIETAYDLVHSANIVYNDTEILTNNKNIIFEGAQGSLLDKDYGFHPYTTWSNTRVEGLKKLCPTMSYFSEIEKIGVIRSFTTRHGNGPLPTELSSIDSSLIRDEDNLVPSITGDFRFGLFDYPLFKYALAINNNNINTLAITHMDKFHDSSNIDICCNYDNFEISNKINIQAPEYKFSLKPQKMNESKLTKDIYSAKPVYETVNLIDLLNWHIPVKYLSYGKTFLDKEII